MMLMTLGDFVFSMETAPYQELTHKTGHRFAMQDRVGQRAAAQSLGPDEETISLPGTIAAMVAGNTSSIDKLRRMERTGQGWQLMDGHGHIFGSFAIISIETRGSYFLAGGTARLTEFTIELRRVG